MNRSGTLQTLGLAGICLIAFWLGLGSLGITDLDEGLYAAASREMAWSGDWVIPRVNGQAFFEKPPALYWAAALAIRAFGSSEAAVRLPSASAATLVVFLTWLFARRRLGSRAAWLAAAFLALAPIHVAAGRLHTTDALLLASMTGALYALYTASCAAPARRTAWVVVAALLCGLGVLVKGAPALAFPLLIVGIWDLKVNRRGARGALRGVAGARTVIVVLVFLAVAAPWHIAAWRSGGQAFVREYVVRQHLQRFRGGDRSHRAPLWFFVPGFLVGFFPWSLLTLPGLLGSSGRETLGVQTDTDHGSNTPAADRDVAHAHAGVPNDHRSLTVFLKTWFWVVFVAFSLSGSKLISYILPLYPAAALLAGDWVATQARRSTVSKRMVLGGIAALVVLVALLTCLMWPAPVLAVINRYADRPVAMSSIEPPLLQAAFWLAATATVALVAFCALLVGRRPLFAVGALIGGMSAFYIVAVGLGLPLINARTIGSLHDLTARAGRLAELRGAVCIAPGSSRRPSVLFYVPTRVARERRIVEADAVSNDDLRRLLGLAPDTAVGNPGSSARPHKRTYPGVLWLITRSGVSLPRSDLVLRPLDARHDYTLWSVEPP